MDIFNPHATDDDKLAEAMMARHTQDLAIIASQGRIADWMGEPRPLDKHLARVLNYTYENGPFAWTSAASAANRRLTAALGFHSPVNAHEAITKCYRYGLLSLDDGQYYMSQQGEYALEEWQLEAEVAGLDVVEALREYKDEWDVDDEFAKLWG